MSMRERSRILLKHRDGNMGIFENIQKRAMDL